MVWPWQIALPLWVWLLTYKVGMLCHNSFNPYEFIRDHSLLSFKGKQQFKNTSALTCTSYGLVQRREFQSGWEKTPCVCSDTSHCTFYKYLLNTYHLTAAECTEQSRADTHSLPCPAHFHGAYSLRHSVVEPGNISGVWFLEPFL